MPVCDVVGGIVHFYEQCWQPEIAKGVAGPDSTDFDSTHKIRQASGYKTAPLIVVLVHTRVSFIFTTFAKTSGSDFLSV